MKSWKLCFRCKLWSFEIWQVECISVKLPGIFPLFRKHSSRHMRLDILHINIALILCQLPYFIRKLLPKMNSYIFPCCNPNIRFLRDILQEPLDSSNSTCLAGNSAMQTNSHHLRRPLHSLLVKSIKCLFQVSFKVSCCAESRRGMKLDIVAIVTISLISSDF